MGGNAVVITNDPVGAVVAARKNGNAVFLRISAFTRNTIAEPPRSGGGRFFTA